MRVILHCDGNSFYASCELTRRPELRGLPVSVCGDVEARRGIILASTPEAKRCGVKTGMVLWQAKRRCPSLITLPPDFGLYTDISRRLRRMYEGYSPRVESFGLDECWVDLTSAGVTAEDGQRLADTLRQRAKQELGVPLSVGVSYNKVFAKLGSDYQKPDATTVITPDNYPQVVWPLPVSALLFIGPKTTAALRKKGIFTIGDLARVPAACLRQWFGKIGLMHHANANGRDASPVMETIHKPVVKSIGNSTTTPRDMESVEDVQRVYTLLADTVTTRLREAGVRGRCIAISVRDTRLRAFGCQKTIAYHTALSKDIVRVAVELFLEKDYPRLLPLRSVGVSVSSLTADSAPVQLDFFGEAARRIRQDALERAVYDLRKRHGMGAIRLGNVLMDAGLAAINPRDEHTVHSVPFYTG